MNINSDVISMDITTARKSLRRGKISSVEITKEYLKAIELCKHLNLYITLDEEKSLAAAQRADERIKKGEGGALCGIPIAVKDLFCTKGIRTTAGSLILSNYIPVYESEITKRLWQEQAVFLGKSNLDEFAMGSSTITSHFGSTINPWQNIYDKEARLTPGGSSGGSAAAVSAYAALAAIGTDTGGSIRQPAAFCGVVGVKPTYGRCSRFGIVAFASSLDQAGPITKNVRDSAIMLNVMAGYDNKDSTSANIKTPDFEKSVGENIKGLKVGIPDEYNMKEIPKSIRILWDKAKKILQQAGAELKDVSLPHTKFALPAYYIIAPAEASSNLARYDGVRFGYRSKQQNNLDEMYYETRGQGFGREVKRRILIGTYVLSAGYYDAYYLKGSRVRRLIKEDFEKAWQDVDCLLTPTTTDSAFALGEKMDDPIKMYMNDVLTVPANLAGLPAISVPIGLEQKHLPVGMQIISRKFDEETMFRVAYVIEKEANFREKPSLAAGFLGAH